MLKFSPLLLLLLIRLRTATGANVITGTVKFYIYNKQLERLVELSNNNSDFASNGCNPTEEFTVVVHGWREGINTEWVNEMMPNMTAYRGGCIMFMSYGETGNQMDYFGDLVPHFEELANNLTNHYRRLEAFGFDPADGFVFGFSFGSQVAIQSGINYGANKLGRIDACEPAGPGFDGNSQRSSMDPTQAAKRVQCIHTSSNYGTSKRNCHVDWDMGECGKSQIAAGPFPKGSHGLCPYFYISAFTHNFYAEPKPKDCTSSRYTGIWPSGYKMGYFSGSNSSYQGEVFSPTTKYYPYNDPNPVTSGCISADIWQ
ncbi:lipase member H-like [Wyeomyia smithii]|uniref:lipase member H-like n=1 Tax=Wyeomyia smithii TaxID=174621 RepID=UPI00246817B6|nr:lipase member H-like [Wyeomyia smithii]